jgi:hypothetical protein
MIGGNNKNGVKFVDFMDNNPGKVPAGTEYDNSHLTCLPYSRGLKF